MSALIERLSGVRAQGQGRYTAKCPAHPDRTASLSVRELSDGRVLLHCFAGCETEAVLGAVGLSFRDVMPERIGEEHSLPRERPAFTAADALRALSSEAGIVALIASDIAEGKAVSEADAGRACTAAGRIAAALEFCYGD